MTTVIAVYNSEGCVGRCDARCHGAKTEACDCICGGRLHGCGVGNALAENTRWVAYCQVFGTDNVETWAKAHGFAVADLTVKANGATPAEQEALL